jgi:hypothetical protein
MKLSITWKGKLVGFIREPKPDNLRLYGRWEPMSGADTICFISTLMDGEEPVAVIVGEGTEGIVEFAPDDWIEIRPTLT